MPIEDVDFLLENCITDNHVIYIDSARRDKRAFPHPNQYTIRFSNPYRLVHGIEVLDASIPSTMFNVDLNNNVLSYMTSPSGDFGATVADLTKVPGFSKVMSYALTDDLSPSPTKYGTATTFKVVMLESDAVGDGDDLFMTPGALRPFVDECLDVDVDALNAADDPFDGFLTGGLPMVPGKPSHLVITKHKMPPVKLYESRKAAEYGSLPVYEVVVDGTKMYTTDANFYDFYACFEKKYGANQTFYDHLKKTLPPEIARSYVLHKQSCEGNTYDWYYYTISNVPAADFDALSASVPPASTFSMERVVFRPGNYSAVSFLKLSERYMTGSLVFDTEEPENVTTFPNFTFIGEMPFIINMQGSSIGSVIGMSEEATSLLPDNYKYIANNPLLYGSLAGNTLVCPGIVNFSVDRYVVLRCDELEDHIYGSYSYGEFTPGIGMFRFFEVDGISHQRNDYVNFTKPPFHPIGKFDKMTLSFYQPDLTNLYDFKGLDHILVLSIKFYAPKQMRKLQISVLNPNYRADFQEYMQQYIDYKRATEVNSSDGMTVHDDVNETNRVREAEIEYDYPSSDPDDDIDGELPDEAAAVFETFDT